MDSAVALQTQTALLTIHVFSVNGQEEITISRCRTHLLCGLGFISAEIGIQRWNAFVIKWKTSRSHYFHWISSLEMLVDVVCKQNRKGWWWNVREIWTFWKLIFCGIEKVLGINALEFNSKKCCIYLASCFELVYDSAINDMCKTCKWLINKINFDEFFKSGGEA